MGAKVGDATPITERADIVELLDRVPLTAMEKDCEKQVCCVTGATSYVGAHIVRRLLRGGHTVHAPVRSPDNEKRVGYLKAMPGAAERLTLFKADLMVDGSYDESMAGCASVVHVASPFVLVVDKKKIKATLIDPAVKGTENVLASCSRTPTVKRVVVTGTTLSACADFTPSKKDKDYTVGPDDWTEGTSEKVLPYTYSKVLADRRAEEICAAQSQWTMSTLLIAGVFGPPCSGKGDGMSCMIMKQVRLGLFFPGCPPMGFPMEDARDVALYHCLAMVAPGSEGRYLPPQRYVTFMEFCTALKKDKRTRKLMLPLFLFPGLFKPVFSACMPMLGMDGGLVNKSWGCTAKYDASKITKDLELDKQGHVPLSVATMVTDMDLSFQKFKIGGLSASLARYK